MKLLIFNLDFRRREVDFKRYHILGLYTNKLLGWNQPKEVLHLEIFRRPLELIAPRIMTLGRQMESIDGT